MIAGLGATTLHIPVAGSPRPRPHGSIDPATASNIDSRQDLSVSRRREEVLEYVCLAAAREIQHADAHEHGRDVECARRLLQNGKKVILESSGLQSSTSILNT